MLTWRIILAASGILLGLFGIFRLLTQISGHSLLALAIWLACALIVVVPVSVAEAGSQLTEI